MYKHYQSVTVDQDAVDADPDLQNSEGNDFDACTFDGTITGVNFNRCRFRSNGTYTGAVFDSCNLININPEGLGVNPASNGATFVNCYKADFEISSFIQPALNRFVAAVPSDRRDALEASVSGSAGGDAYIPALSFL